LRMRQGKPERTGRDVEGKAALHPQAHRSSGPQM
jgi:hypothetical protein